MTAAGAVTWHANDGASPPAFTSHTIGTHTGTTRVLLADIDNDGPLDVVVAGTANFGSVWWFENDGTPAVGEWTKRIADSGYGAGVDATTVDLDQDGDIDIVVGAHSGTANYVFVLQNDGTPTDTHRLGLVRRRGRRRR